MVDPVVQKYIAATNGIHYTDKVEALKEYPRYSLPVRDAPKPNALMLDIGCGWGRWLVAGADKGYIPIGVDLRSWFAQTSRKVLRQANKVGYTVAGDLEHLPFKNGIFDLIWSFSVIQHVHKDKMLSCLSHINRILSWDGYTFLEFPNKNGIRNRMGTAQYWEKYKDIKEGENRMKVRYYTPKEYREFFNNEFGNFRFTNHSFVGIGVLKEDLNYVNWKNKILCSASLAGSALTKVIPGLKYLSDSLYIQAKSNKEKKNEYYKAVAQFLGKHQVSPGNNLNIVPLLQCPISGNELELNREETRLYVKGTQHYYPVEDFVPILLPEERR